MHSKCIDVIMRNSAAAPPVICGTNTGYHMYVHASDQCNELSAVFGSASTATTSAFTIKVSRAWRQGAGG